MLAKKFATFFLLIILFLKDDDANPCKPEVVLDRCSFDSPVDEKYNWSTHSDHKINIYYKRGCNTSIIRNYWTLETKGVTTRLDEFDNKPVLRFPPYFLQKSLNHAVKAHVLEISDTHKIEKVELTCYITMMVGRPLVLIDGGAMKRVGNKEDLLIDGSRTSQYCCRPGTPECYMKFEWTCSGLSFCHNFVSTERTITIPRAALPQNPGSNGHSFTVRLVVVGHFYEEIFLREVKEQTLEVHSTDDPIVEIHCLKNCPPSTVQHNKYDWSLFYVKCLYKCEGLVFRRHRAFDGNWKEDGVHTDTHFALEPHDNMHYNYLQYAIYDHTTGKKLAVSDKYQTPYFTDNGWTYEPSFGDPHATYEILRKCKAWFNKDADHHILFYQNGILLKSAPSRVEHKISTHVAGTEANSKFSVWMYDYHINTRFICKVSNWEIEAKVNLIYSGKDVKGVSDTLNKIYNGTFKTYPPLDELLDENRWEHGIQLINTLVHQAAVLENNPEAATFRLNFGFRMIQDLMKFPIVSPYENEPVIMLLMRIMKFACANVDICDIDLRRINSAFVRNLLIEYRTEFKRRLFPYSQEREILAVVREVCTLMLQQEKYFYHDPTHLTINPIYNISQSLNQTVEEEFPIEDYPNYYFPNADYYMKVRLYEEFTYNTMDVFRILGLIVGRTLHPRSVQYSEHGKNLPGTFVVRKEPPYIFATKKITCQTLSKLQQMEITSTGLSEYKYALLIMTCYFHKNLLWWYRERPVDTAIIDVLLYDPDENRIESFPEPLTITFQRYDFSNVTMDDKFHAYIPHDRKYWTTDYMDTLITVIKFILQPGESIQAHFDGIDNTVYLDVVFKENTRPTYKEFLVRTENRHHILIHKNQTVASYVVERLMKRPIEIYMGVLPNERTLSRKRRSIRVDGRTVKADGDIALLRITFWLGYENLRCVSWMRNPRKWDGSHCQVNPNTAHLKPTCDCYDGTTFAAYYVTNPERVREDLDIHFSFPKEMLNPQYFIFLNVFLAFLIFCLASIYWIRKRSLPEKEIIFLSDNIIANRHGYLIIVRTGKYRSSGTTSKIFIKLKGREAETRPHVLNRPDPENRLLQPRGEEWFFLATGQHLGDLIGIKLWFDSNGCRASWYCENIEVYDLQSNLYWFFNVNKWFDLLRSDGVDLIRIAPTDLSSNQRDSLFHQIVDLEKPVHTWNWISTSKQDISYLKQLTLVLMNISTCYWFSLLFYGLPKFIFADHFYIYGHYELYPAVIGKAVLIILITCPLNLGTAHLFRLRKRRTTLAAWSICIVTIIIALTFAIVYGFWVQKIKGLLCATSAIIALLVNLFLLETVYIVVMRIIALSRLQKRIRTRKLMDVCDVCEKAEVQRDCLSKVLGRKLMRRPFLKEYSELTKEEIKKRRIKEKEQLYLFHLTRDLIMFGLYFIILFIIFSTSRDSQFVYSNEEMKNLLVTALNQRTIGLYAVRNTSSMKKYINETLIGGVHGVAWYHTFYQKNPGQMSDYNNKILGVVHIRQHRVANNSCPNPERAKELNTTCASEFGFIYQRSFGERWHPGTYYFIEYRRLEHFWHYRRSGPMILGTFKTYPRGGYLAVLGRTKYNSYFNFGYMVENNWFDRHTRMISFELLVYNVNYNLFNSLKMVLEKTASGYFEHYHTIDTTRFLQLDLNLDYLIVLFVTAIGILLLSIIVSRVYGLFHGFLDYFKNIWNVIDFLVILISLAAILLYKYREHMVEEFMEGLNRANKNEFIDFYHLFQFEYILVGLTALLVFLTTIRLWKLLRFGRIFRRLEHTIVFSIYSLISLFFCQCIILLGFAIWGYLLFGSHSKSFRRIWISARTLFLISLNLYRQFDYKTFNSNLGRIYYILFIFLNFIIYAMYIAVVIIGRSKSEDYFSRKRSKYWAWTFLKDEFIHFWNIVGIKRDEGIWRFGLANEVKQPKVYPKKKSVRYGKCVKTTMRRMKAMEAIAKAVLFKSIPEKERKDDDFEVMRGVANTMHLMDKDDFTVENNDLFFVTKDKNGKRVLVENRNLMRMRRIVQQLLVKEKIEDAPRSADHFKEIKRLLFVLHETYRHIHIQEDPEQEEQLEQEEQAEDDDEI